MFFIFTLLIKADSNYCSTVYNLYGCRICITHFADRQCGWCSSTNTCESNLTKTCSPTEFIFGPNSKCDEQTIVVPTPTPTPSPTPSSLIGQCKIYTNEGCSVCSSHYTDRNCGWCETTKECVDISTGKESCSADSFYYGEAGVCGKPISTPMPVWPVYSGNTSFCSSLSGTWCSNCISKDPSMSCGWCGATKECIPGYADGPLNLFCEKDWSFTLDRKCNGTSSHSAIVGMRVGIGIFVGIVVILCIVGCVKVIRQPDDTTYEEVDSPF